MLLNFLQCTGEPHSRESPCPGCQHCQGQPRGRARSPSVKVLELGWLSSTPSAVPKSGSQRCVHKASQQLGVEARVSVGSPPHYRVKQVLHMGSQAPPMCSA